MLCIWNPQSNCPKIKTYNLQKSKKKIVFDMLGIGSNYVSVPEYCTEVMFNSLLHNSEF